MANRGSTFPAEVFGDDTIKKIFDTFPESATGLRNRALIMVYLRCQLRCQEGLDLRVCDVSRERNSVTVLKGKGGKRRVVGVDNETLDAIDKWMAARRPTKSDLVFTTHVGAPLDPSYVRKMFKRHARKAGVGQRVHLHGLRHSGAVKMVKSGVPLNVIRKRLGHTTLTITQRYIDHLTDDEENEYLQQVQW